jgi:hypothetical protein
VYESRREYEKAIGVLNEINDRYAGTATGIAEQVKERIAKLRTKMSVNNAAIKDTVVVQSR